MSFKRAILLSALLLFFVSNSHSQVIFSTDFDSGSIGDVKLIDSNWVKRSESDSILTLSYQIESRFDPINPIDTTLKPSARWYHFRMVGVKDKNLFLTIKNSEVVRPVYSFNGEEYFRFEESQNNFKGGLNFSFDRDTVYIAYCFPYPYKRLSKKMEEWKALPYVEYTTIGESAQGRPLEMLTITNSSLPDEGKKKIWIHGRTHPSETPSSWHLEGLLDHLLADTPFANELRSSTIFYVVPINNPDGVIGGYSRSTSTGVNLEINWGREEWQTEPEVKALKKVLEDIGKVELVLNMHSQISPSLTYWLHTEESTSPYTYKMNILISALTINYTPYFRPQDQSFSAIAPRYVEGWLWDRYGDETIAVTFETTYSYYNKDRTGEWVTLENLKDLSLSSLYAVSDYLNLSPTERALLIPQQKRSGKGWQLESDLSKITFEREYLRAEREGATLKYRGWLPKGSYKLYRWVAGKAEKEFDPATNRWEFIETIQQKREGNFRYKYRSKEAGEISDRLLLVKERD